MLLTEFKGLVEQTQGTITFFSQQDFVASLQRNKIIHPSSNRKMLLGLISDEWSHGLVSQWYWSLLHNRNYFEKVTQITNAPLETKTNWFIQTITWILPHFLNVIIDYLSTKFFTPPPLRDDQIDLINNLQEINSAQTYGERGCFSASEKLYGLYPLPVREELPQDYPALINLFIQSLHKVPGGFVPVLFKKSGASLMHCVGLSSKLTMLGCEYYYFDPYFGQVKFNDVEQFRDFLIRVFSAEPIEELGYEMMSPYPNTKPADFYSHINKYFINEQYDLISELIRDYEDLEELANQNKVAAISCWDTIPAVQSNVISSLSSLTEENVIKFVIQHPFITKVVSNSYLNDMIQSKLPAFLRHNPEYSSMIHHNRDLRNWLGFKTPISSLSYLQSLAVIGGGSPREPGEMESLSMESPRSW